MNTLRSPLALASLVLALAVPRAQAYGQDDCLTRADQPVQQDPSLDVKVVEAIGRGTILGGDVANARNLAIEDAREKAIESAAGVEIEAESEYVRQLMASSDVIVKTRGVVVDVPEVLCETTETSGLYAVRVRVKVGRLALLRALDEFARSRRVLVADDGAGGLADRLKEALQARGFQHVVLSGPVSAPPAKVKAALDGDEQALRELANRADSDLVVLGAITAGEAKSPGGQYFRVPVTARVVAVRVPAGTELFRASLPAAVTGTGTTADEARGKASKKAAQEMAALAARKLNPTADRDIVIVLKGATDFTGCERFRNFASMLPGVKNLRLDGACTPGESRFVAQYGRRLDLLSASISTDRSYLVTSTQASKDLLEVQVAR